jgi:hypothetical protein
VAAPCAFPAHAVVAAERCSTCGDRQGYSSHDLIQTDGVVRAQVLRADVTARGQPPVLPWSSARRTQRAQPSRSDSTRPSPLEMETRHVPHDRSHGADRQAGHDSLPAGLAVVGPTPDESMTSINPLAVSDILCALSAQQARAQPAGAALPSDADPLREPRWGQGGPWAGIWITMTCQAALDTGAIPTRKHL